MGKMKIKIGDRIRHSVFGGKQFEGIVEHIEICPRGEKYGRPVASATIGARNGTVILDNGHWCYFDQVKAVL